MAFKCCFCGSQSVQKIHTGLFHKIFQQHGPFDFYKCKNCGSGLTLPVLRAETLTQFYSKYEEGLPESYRQGMKSDPQTQYYRHFLNRIIHIANKKPADSFLWIEAGAGGGEMSSLMAQHFLDSRGLAIDLHDRPAHVSGIKNLEWTKLDLNDDNFSSHIKEKADLIFATAVWEHVLKPDVFLSNLVKLLKPGGTLYLVCPNFGSFARRFLGRHWPYFQPGEHLNMPSLKGAKLSLSKYGSIGNIIVRPLALPYTIGYVFARLGLTQINSTFPSLSKLSFPMAAGALEASLTLDSTPMQISIHADDLGATKSVTKDILELWALGALDGFSILANGEDTKRISKSLRENPSRPAKISVHLNLSEGQPLTSISDRALLVDRKGFFNLTFGKIILAWMRGTPYRNRLSQQIKTEWKEQIRCVQNIVAPRKISAVDGHLHAHMIPFLFSIAAELCTEMKISEIRISMEPFYISQYTDFLKPFFLINILKNFVLTTCSFFVRPLAKNSGLKSTDGVIGILYTGQMTRERISAGIQATKKKKMKSVEVIVHPGRTSVDELKRWENVPAIGTFYHSKWRDIEKESLIEINRNQRVEST